MLYVEVEVVSRSSVFIYLVGSIALGLSIADVSQIAAIAINTDAPYANSTTAR